MKNTYDAPEFKVVSLLAETEICAGEFDEVNGAQPGIVFSGVTID